MGTYLSTPITDKHTESGHDLPPGRGCNGSSNGNDSNTNDNNNNDNNNSNVSSNNHCSNGSSISVSWGVVDMQGWRKSMEDAHVARTDVPVCPPSDANATSNGSSSYEHNSSSKKAKVFAVFDGHGGAEVARFCQVNLVNVLMKQAAWGEVGRVFIADNNNQNACANGEDKVANATENGEIANENSAAEKDQTAINEASTGSDNTEAETKEETIANRIGQALIHSFHALDRLIDDPSKREEIERWRSERPPVYIHGNVDGTSTNSNSVEESGGDGESNGDDVGKVAANLQELHLIGVQSESEESWGDAATDNVGGTTTEGDESSNETASSVVDSINNDVPEGIIHDDSDDEKEEEESGIIGILGENTSTAYSLISKLLHMGPSDVDITEEEEEEGENDTAESTSIPTPEQLLNPPCGIVAPSSSIPTKIMNGRKVCNLPDHPVHAGCTSVVAVILENVLVVANAGDSRAVLCRKGGLVEPMSFDHKPLQKREMNRITKAGGFVNQFGRVNGNLNLSRSIGDLKYKQVPGISPADQMITAEPDIMSTTLRPGDEFIVLGCDGIWDCLSNEECIKYVRDRIDTKSPVEIGTEMLDEIVSDDPRASQGIGGDNMTVMIIDLLPGTRKYLHQ
ncbi:hypothetical protein ACHAWO_005477 [Cyclotella atomus]|uniref:protein-serine/threonine phosphatase n=1 Tax=Cyclotella atomus TaxID=382360 RepID=A0ABD3QAC3_9STRA